MSWYKKRTRLILFGLEYNALACFGDNFYERVVFRDSKWIERLLGNLEP